MSDQTAHRYPGQRARAGPDPDRRRRSPRRRVEVEIVTVARPATSPARRSPRSGSACSPPRCATRLPRGEVDVAVHSYKDLPTAPDPRLSLAAVPPRRTRATRWSPATGSRWANCRRARGRHRARAARRAAAGARSRPGDRADSRQRGHPAAEGRPTASSTPSCWPGPGWPGSAGSRRSPRCSTRSRCCPRPRRARWPWSAGSTTSTLEHLLRSSVDDEGTRAAVDRRARSAGRARGRLQRARRRAGRDGGRSRRARAGSWRICCCAAPPPTYGDSTPPAAAGSAWCVPRRTGDMTDGVRLGRASGRRAAGTRGRRRCPVPRRS